MTTRTGLAAKVGPKKTKAKRAAPMHCRKCASLTTLYRGVKLQLEAALAAGDARQRELDAMLHLSRQLRLERDDAVAKLGEMTRMHDTVTEQRDALRKLCAEEKARADLLGQQVDAYVDQRDNALVAALEKNKRVNELENTLRRYEVDAGAAIRRHTDAVVYGADVLLDSLAKLTASPEQATQGDGPASSPAASPVEPPADPFAYHIDARPGSVWVTDDRNPASYVVYVGAAKQADGVLRHFGVVLGGEPGVLLLTVRRRLASPSEARSHLIGPVWRVDTLRAQREDAWAAAASWRLAHHHRGTLVPGKRHGASMSYFTPQEFSKDFVEGCTQS